MKKHFIVPFVLAFCALLVSSCVQPSAPEAQFIEYKVAGVSSQGIEVNFFFNIKNKNPLPIDINNYSYKVYIEGQELLNEERGGFNLGANSEKIIHIPVMIKYQNVFGSINAVIQRIAQGKKTISYSIDGSLNAGSMGLTVTTPIKASGEIPLPQDLNSIKF
ncbi:MAG: LEA type 2 family protein [Candidatus Saganbacteria bacterium]|nr:LEA type 2 family protein [Candidatus Saganbacteria bacterium]